MSEIIFTYITCETREQAETIGATLVEENLAACANVFPVSTSIYKWEGKLQQTDESVVLLKTRPELFPQLEARAKQLHSYKTPCILAFEASQGSAEFIAWVKEKTSS